MNAGLARRITREDASRYARRDVALRASLAARLRAGDSSGLAGLQVRAAMGDRDASRMISYVARTMPVVPASELAAILDGFTVV